MRLFVTLGCVLALAAGVWAQDEKPLGDIAREQSKTEKPKAKLVVDSESIKGPRLPIPDIAMDRDNSDDIVASIMEYKGKHTAKDTEVMVHDWYDRQEGIAQSALEDLRRTQQRQSDLYSNQPTDIKDYQKYAKERQLRAQQLRPDPKTQAENQRIVMKTYSTMNTVRYKLISQRMSYDWMMVKNFWEY